MSAARWLPAAALWDGDPRPYRLTPSSASRVAQQVVPRPDPDPVPPEVRRDEVACQQARHHLNALRQAKAGPEAIEAAELKLAWAARSLTRAVTGGAA